MLIVAGGAPRLVKAIEQRWPASDRRSCCVHRARSLYAKLAERERERFMRACWGRWIKPPLDRTDSRRLQGLVDQLDRGGLTAREPGRCATGRDCPRRTAWCERVSG